MLTSAGLTGKHLRDMSLATLHSEETPASSADGRPSCQSSFLALLKTLNASHSLGELVPGCRLEKLPVIFLSNFTRLKRVRKEERGLK